MTSSIKSITSGGTTTLVVSGDFKFDLYSAFRDAIDVLDPNTRIIVDLAKVTSMDSSAMGMLLNMKQSLGRPDREIRIVNSPENILKLLLMARFDRKFDIS